MIQRIRIRRRSTAAILLVLLGGCDLMGGQQARYESQESAGEALRAAVSSGETSAMLRVLGQEARAVVESGDAVEDANTRNAFVALYDATHRWESDAETSATLLVGDDDWPFPFPLVREAEGWRFDTSNGVEEILNRRIGDNELAAIQASLAYLDAQREYYWWNPQGEPLLHYAGNLVSTDERKDGLYWDAEGDEAPSPLGALFAAARAEGYLVDAEVRPVPYYGYHFRILKAQGERAAGGAYDYVVDGLMIGGFALVAYPAEYGSTGVMTFIVNHDGVVFSKNLGPDTAKLATEMASFDPDESWKREP